MVFVELLTFLLLTFLLLTFLLFVVVEVVADFPRGSTENLVVDPSVERS